MGIRHDEKSFMHAVTALAPHQVIRMARSVGERVTGPTRDPAYVHCDGVAAQRLHFSVRRIGDLRELMSFDVRAASSRSETWVSARVVRFVVDQPRLLFIPVGPRSVLGYALYRSFAMTLLDELAERDPELRGEFVEAA